jgi:hypothetical protein
MLSKPNSVRPPFRLDIPANNAGVGMPQNLTQGQRAIALAMVYPEPDGVVAANCPETRQFRTSPSNVFQCSGSG